MGSGADCLIAKAQVSGCTGIQLIRRFVRIWCPRQESNPALTAPERVAVYAPDAKTYLQMSCLGAYRAQPAWPRLPGMPGRNGISSNRMRRLHSKTHPLIAAMRYVGDTKRRSWALGPQERGSVFSSEADHTTWSTSGLQQRV
jgi:hypothetical protein